MREAMRRLLTTQDHLRNLAKIRQIPYAGMTLRVINFQERKYPQQYYRCPDGFSFVQAFINLSTWQDIDFFLSFENLFKSDMIKRIISIALRQVVKYIESVSQRLAHIIHQLFRMNLARRIHQFRYRKHPMFIKFPR